MNPNLAYNNQTHPNPNLAYNNQINPNLPFNSQIHHNLSYSNQINPNPNLPLNNQIHPNLAYNNQIHPNLAYNNQIHPLAYSNQIHPNPNANLAYNNQMNPNLAHNNQIHPTYYNNYYNGYPCGNDPSNHYHNSCICKCSHSSCCKDTHDRPHPNTPPVDSKTHLHPNIQSDLDGIIKNGNLPSQPKEDQEETPMDRKSEFLLAFLFASNIECKATKDDFSEYHIQGIFVYQEIYQ
jgi:hypothetical protein